MISIRRVLTIVFKDMLWAAHNYKLLSIMLVPVFAVVFFSRLDSQMTFGFSLAFVNVFIGLFSTSYLIIEEKNKGTLLALLTTPLTGSELLLGKFLFNLLICLSFSILAFVLNGRIDLLLNPLALIHLAFFAGTTCFLGFTMGVFFRNEQEMSVVAPIVMIGFIFGAAVDKFSNHWNLHSFFPDYHFVTTVKSVTIDSPIAHIVFAALLFFVSFSMAANYTGFYFSNSRESRFSSKLFLWLLAFFVCLGVSGLYFNTLEGKTEKKVPYRILRTPVWTVNYQMPSKEYKAEEVLVSDQRQVYRLKNLQKDGAELLLSVREVETDETSLKARQVKMSQDRHRTPMSRTDDVRNGEPIQKWIYIKGNKLIVLSEALCADQILQWSLTTAFEQMEFFETHFKEFEAFDQSIQPKCLDQKSNKK